MWCIDILYLCLQVYGQCKAAIFINKVHRVERLYKYSCVIRPVPAARVHEMYPDCPTLIHHDNNNVQKTVSHSLEKFNKESGLANRFALLKICRAAAGVSLPYLQKEHHTHRHAHDHSHDHSHSHDHVHTHHDKAHNHSSDFPNQHHDYKHAEGVHTHEHDHELALDHDHKHGHLHEHEHHHHHHEHEHENAPHDHPEGMVTMLPALGQPVTLPSFPDVPAGGPELGVTLPLKPNPQIPGEMDPAIEPFPTSVSDQCPVPKAGRDLVEKLFAEDAFFMLAV
uniref:Fetuin B n=1 Tax=Pundamilia nyererei TaxID=303518 RepID=A0A3B4H9E3_9CICH